MDPASALSGKTQISVQCSQCNFTLTKWLSQVKSVDNGITLFKEELLALQLTYDRLSSSLKDTSTSDAARIADRYTSGHLWSQVSTALSDCQSTILSLKQSLENIEYGSRRVSSMLKHLAEALSSGDLVITRDTIRLLDQNLAFPVSMINITLLLQRSDLKESSQKFVLRELAALKNERDGFLSKTQQLLRSSSSAGNKVIRNMVEFAATVNDFLASATAMLQTPTSVETQSEARQYWVDATQEPARDESVQEVTTIVQTNHFEDLREAISTAQAISDPPQDLQSMLESEEHDNEIELELTLEYMANGHADLEIEDYNGAEENFRRALEMAVEHDFSDRLDYGPSDITLILAECLMQQEKEEEALELLEPLADGTAAFLKSDDTASIVTAAQAGPDRAVQYKANHILGSLFLKRLDYQSAEKRAKEAFKGRRKILGAHNTMTLESVRLVIDIYSAKGDSTSARAYRRFLEPPTKSRSALSSTNTAKLRPDRVVTIPTTQTPISIAPPTTQSEERLAVRSDSTDRPPSRSPVPFPTRTSHDLTTQEASHSPALPQALPPSPHREASKRLQELPRSPPAAPPATQSQSQHSSPRPEPPVQPRPLFGQLPLENISEESHPIQPVKTKNSTSTLPKIEPDPLPPNIGPAIANTRKKMNWANPFFSKSNTTKSETSVFKKSELSSESGSQEASRNSSVTGLGTFSDTKRQMSLAGNLFDTKSFFSNFGDDKERRPSMSSRAYSVSTHPPARTRPELEPRFRAINSLRQEGKKSASIDTAIKLLREYDPDRKVLMVREAELKKNMKESHKAMAGTGYGYAPIHFFCERKVEANIEVELLIEQGVDVNAVACKAGMPGTDPFTPLQRAVELGHAEIVRLLLAEQVVIGPPRMPKEPNMGNKDHIMQPLLIACQKGHTEITYILLKAGAGRVLKEFPQRQWHGNSLLHEACWLADTEMVKMLLEYTKQIKKEHRLSGPGQPDYQSGVIGSPGQQDQFGATPVMYAIDIRDCTNDKMRETKINNRKHCLRMLLEHDVHGDLNTQAYRESVAQMLSLKWTRGPGSGHSIFCYADETGDDELVHILDPFKYQVSPGMRCSATPRCSASLRTGNVYVGNSSGGGDGPGRTVRLPSFPELMSTPVHFPTEAEANEAPPPSFESAVGTISSLGSRSPTFDHSRSLSMAGSTRVGSETGTNFS